MEYVAVKRGNIEVVRRKKRARAFETEESPLASLLQREAVDHRRLRTLHGDDARRVDAGLRKRLDRKRTRLVVADHRNRPHFNRRIEPLQVDGGVGDAAAYRPLD